MKNIFPLTCLLLLLQIASAQQSNPLKLWYNKPAKDWNEALPLGNGRLGAMVFGNVQEELIQLNEQTLWTGGPTNLNPNPDAPQYLPQVRQALFNDSISQAVKLLKKMQGPNTNMYQPLGNLYIKQTAIGNIENYYRDVNIATATATTGFTISGVAYTREMFVSAPDQVFVLRLNANKKGALNFDVNINHELPYVRTINNKELILNGKARITNDERRSPKPFIFTDSLGCNGMRFQWRVKVLSMDGILKTDTALHITNASDVVLLIAAATSFNGYDKCPDKDGKNEVATVNTYLINAAKKNFIQLQTAHIKDYQKYFNRVQLSLTNQPPPNLPIDERLQLYKTGLPDPSLEMLYYQFGRYLLISSSRPGGIPANLQGIWNKELRPPWRSNYTSNINLQMNYWPAEMCNLSEMAQPLLEHIKRLAINGTSTAQNYYHMRGWAVHHNTDIWAQTNPVGEGGGDPKWSNWAMGSPWLSQHLYEHYRFTGNKKYLQETAYPLMKTAAQFCLDWLVEKNGILVTAPSTSPENVYIQPNGVKGTVTIASAMDMEIIWDLFNNIIEASTILHADTAFATILKQKIQQLQQLKIGKKGNLVEWYDDWDDEDPQHRHVSHLFGLHPGRQISPLVNVDYAAACRNTLTTRGDGGTGWSKAWKINFWARLLDGDHAYKMYQEMLKNSTLNNLFDTHPPFQIDGNFGATAGITEMLLQSQLSDIQLLPALPTAWQTGHVKGLMARGNFEIDMFWQNGQLVTASIKSKNGGLCKIRTSQNVIIQNTTCKTTTSKLYNVVQYINSFNTIAGKTYTLQIKK